MKRVLLAVGNSEYSNILRSHFSKHTDSFSVTQQEVMHHRYLLEVIDLERPDILIIHDYYLPTDSISQDDREQEWLKFLQEIRGYYDDAVRVVFLCERSKGDPFLHYLISCNVLDIFNSNAIVMEEMMDQLKDKARFSRVAKFRTAGKELKPLTNPGLEEEETEQSQDESTEREKTKSKKPKEKPEKPIVQKVVEKKVVNKQVVKRDYNIQVMNQVEKVVGVPVEKKLILIGSPFPRSGSTFIAHLLAKELATTGVSVNYIENPYDVPYTYDRFIGQELAPDYLSKFYQFTEELDPKVKHEFDWTLEGVSLTVKHPTRESFYDSEDVPFDVFIKVLLASQSTITIVDVGNDWDKPVFRDIFDIATHAYFVLEPDLSNMQYIEDTANQATLLYRSFMDHEKSTIIGNRTDKSLLNNDIIKEWFRNMNVCVPAFPSQDVFEAQVKGTFLNDMSKSKETIREAFKPILADLLPDSFIKKQSSSTNFIKGLFKKRVSISKT